jgi:hypothetical protein
MYHPFYRIHSNTLYTGSSSPCHHQPGCENPHQFQQSVRESIALNHLSTGHMHSSPHQNMTKMFAGHQLFSLVFLCATVTFVSTFSRRHDLKTLEFPEKASFYPFFFVGGPSVKALGSHGGVGWELRRLY